MNRFSLKQLKEENKLLIIGDIATNHCGDINHGLDIINSFHEVIKDYSEFYFSFKFQYRDIKNSFIHKHYKDTQNETIPLTIVNIGDSLIITVPVELFVEFSLELKKRLKNLYRVVFVVELVNGWAGYVPTEKAFQPENGGYEVQFLNSSKLREDAGKIMIHTLYEMENEEPDLSGKKVAFFGAGDQDTHGEHFVSALGKMKDIFSKLGADTEYGYWTTEGYNYTFSLAEQDGKFCGLALDNVNQADLTPERITTWAEQVKKEMEI